MTRNWLVEVAPTINVAEMVEYLPPPSRDTPNLDLLLEKLATAEILGKELAHKEPDLLKTAMTPGLLGVGKTVANVMSKNPAKALRVGGALAGGAAGALHTPGIDPNSGQQRSRIGSTLVGAAAGYGAGSMAGKSQAVKGFVQNQGGELKNVVEQARQAQKATKAIAPAAAVGTPSATPPAAGQQIDLNLAPGSGANPATAGAKKWYNPSSWFNKAAEALEVNEGLSDHGPLTGTGKPGVLVATKGEGKMVKRALALPPGLMNAAKGVGNFAMRRPGTAAALGGAAVGAAAGGPDHRIGGALTGAGMGIGLQRGGSALMQRGSTLAKQLPAAAPQKLLPPPGVTSVSKGVDYMAPGVPKFAAFMPQLGNAAKAVGNLALKHPGATSAAAGAGIGAIAGGEDHRLGGAALGAGAGFGAQRLGAHMLANRPVAQAAQATRALEAPAVQAAAPLASEAKTLAGATPPSGGTLNGMGAPATSASKIAPAQAGAPSLAGGSGSIPASGLSNPALKPSPQHLSDAPWEDVAASEWGADSPSHQQVVERYLSGSGLKPGGSLGTAATQLQRPSGTMVGAGGIASARPATQPLRAGMPTAATRSIPRQSMAQMAV